MLTSTHFECKTFVDSAQLDEVKTKRKDHTAVLGTLPMGRLIARIAIPSSFALFVTSTYNLVDAVFVGRGVGPAAIGALTIVLPLQMMVMALGSLVAVGGSSIVSRALGANESRRANIASGTVISLAILVGAVIAIIGEVFLDGFLMIFGASGDLLEPSRSYLRVILLTEPFILFNLTANTLMRAEGQAKAAMATMVFGFLLNIVLDPIFIFVFNFGIAGAAWATVIGRSTTAILVLIYYLRGRSSLNPAISDFVPRFAVIREVASVGVSAFVLQLGSSINATVRNNLLVAYGGTIFLSSFGAVFRTIVFLGMPGMGIAQAIQPIAGYNYGAKNYDRVRRSVWVAISICTIIMSGAFLFTQLFPGLLLKLYTSDPALVSEGISIMRISAFLFLFFPAYIIAPYFYQALGKPTSALTLSLTRPTLAVILMLIFARTGGAMGVVYADPFAVTFGAIFAILYLRKSTKRIGSTASDV